MRRLKIVPILILLMTVFMWSFAYAGTVDLQKTGQKACYNTAGAEIACANTGQDGEKRAGVEWSSPRFTVGTGAEADCVTDNLTGLMWVKSPDSTARIWADALSYANNLNLCGYNDWRLPNVNELESLVHAGQANTAEWLNTQGFSNVQADYYWSSTTYAYNIGHAWFVNMYDGYVVANNKTLEYYVWPVRAGQSNTPDPLYSANVPKTGQTTNYGTRDDGALQRGVAWPSPRFTVSGDCVTDNLTGLMWVKSPDSTTRIWADALSYANNLNLCGYNDWRLPNRKEIRSLINYGQANTAEWLNTQGFSNVLASYYWSSTTYASYTDIAWVVYMFDGYVVAGGKDDGYYVWPVRGGQLGNLVNLFITKAGTGTVTSDPGEINYGTVRQDMFVADTSVTLTAIADSGKYFWYWTQDCSSCGTNNSCNITMNTHKQCTATFGDVPQYTLTVNKTGTGTVKSIPAGIDCGGTCNYQFNNNEKVTLLFSPTPTTITVGGTSITPPTNAVTIRAITSNITVAVGF